MHKHQYRVVYYRKTDTPTAVTETIRAGHRSTAPQHDWPCSFSSTIGTCLSKLVLCIALSCGNFHLVYAQSGSMQANGPTTNAGADPMKMKNNHLATPAFTWILMKNQQQLYDKPSGHVPLLTEQARAETEGHPFDGDNADAGLLDNVVEQMKQFADDIAKRGMQTLCKINPLVCATNVILQGIDNKFTDSSADTAK